MNKIIKIIILTLLGAGCFSAGLYYATLEFDETLDNIMGEYEIISEKVDVFVDVTNPETVQAYTTELRRILDDIKFLHVLIESGEIADEKLDEYLASQLVTQQGNVDRLSESLSSINTEVSSMLDSSHTHIHGMVEELEGNVKSLLSENIDKQKQTIQDLNTQLTELHIKLNEVNKVIDKIKNSKLRKYLK
jgi:hypothetical protein